MKTEIILKDEMVVAMIRRNVAEGHKFKGCQIFDDENFVLTFEKTRHRDPSLFPPNESAVDGTQ